MQTPRLQDEVSATARAIVAELGYTHKQAREIVGMSKSTFSRVINGIKLDNLTELAEVIERLGGDPRRLIQVGGTAALPPAIRWAAEQLEALPDDEQQRALDVLKSLTRSAGEPPVRSIQQRRIRSLIDSASPQTLRLVEGLIIQADINEAELDKANGA